MPVKESAGKLAPPTPLARRLASQVVGYGLAVGLAMAPFLGRVPGVDALLQLFPDEMRSRLFTLSVFFVGILAVSLQFQSRLSINRALLKRRFSLARNALLVGLLVFLGLHAGFVQTYGYKEDGRQHSKAVVVGFSRVSATRGCGCAADDADLKCLERISALPAAIEECWGSRPVRLARFSLQLSYLFLTGGFVTLVGLLLLQEQNLNREASKGKRRRPTKSPPAPPAPEEIQ
jgi:hypothetical protein